MQERAMKVLSALRTISEEVPRMSSIVVGGLWLVAACDQYVVRNVNWHTVLLAFQQISQGFRAGESSFRLLYDFVVIFAVAAVKLVFPMVAWIVTPELLKRATTDRLRMGYWWLHGIEYREARLSPISLGLN